MDEKQLQMLFNEYGKSNGFSDYNEFKSLMANDSSRKIFFDESNKDLGFKDYNEFNTILGFDSKEVKQQSSLAKSPFADAQSLTQQALSGAAAQKQKQIRTTATEGFKLGEEVIPKAPVNKAGTPIGVAIGKDKKIGGSTPAAVYNTLVESVGRLAGGGAYVGTNLSNLQQGMPYIPGVGVVPIKNPEEARSKVVEFVEKARSSASTKEQEQERKDFDVTNGISAKDVEAMAFQAPSLLADLVAGAYTAGGSFILQSVNDNAKDLAENPNAQDLSEGEKTAYIYTQAAIQAALEKVGLDKILKSTGLTKKIQQKITNEVVDEFTQKGVKATAKELEDAIVKKASQTASTLKRVGTGVLAESSTEAAQSIAQDELKVVLNKIKGKEIFDEADIQANLLKNAINSGVLGAGAGGVFGGAVGTMNNTDKEVRRQIAQVQSPADLEALQQQINEQVELGNITEEEANRANIKAEQYAQIAARIPQDIDADTKYAIIGGIEQREDLTREVEKVQQEIESLDPAFQKTKKDQLDLLQGKLGEVNDYIETLVTGEKFSYKSKDGKYLRVSEDGEETEVSKTHYDLATTIQKNNANKKGVTTLMPEDISKPDVTTISAPEIKPETKKSTTSIILPKQNEIKESQTEIIQPKADEGTITEPKSIEGRLPESEGETIQQPTEKKIIAENKPVENIEGTETKPIEDIQGTEQLSDQQHRTNIEDAFRKEFKNKGIPDEQITGALALMDARAKSAVSRGEVKSADEWYRKIADVKSGEFQTETPKQYQLPDGRKVMGMNQPEVVNGFYSPLEKTIAETKLEKLPAKQWIEKFGKGEEAKWTGLTDWLNQQQGSVSKADIQQFLKDNRIEVVEVQKVSRENSKREQELQSYLNENNSRFIRFKDWLDKKGIKLSNEELSNEIAGGDNKGLYEKWNEDKNKYENDYAQKQFELNGIRQQPEGNTKFSQYQLEGQKENYKEVLVTMPETKQKESIVKQSEKELADAEDNVTEALKPLDAKAKELYGERYTNLNHNEKSEVQFAFYEKNKEVISNYDNAVKKLREAKDKNISAQQEAKNAKFQSTHFDETNILVHLRMNTRTDAEGNKVLFLEEVQSDWGQKGKKEGFDISESEKVQLRKEAQDNIKRRVDILEEQKEIGSSNKKYWELQDESDALRKRKEEIDTKLFAQTQPTAPFVTDTNSWTKLGLKVALKEAVKQGAYKIAWTTGDQQNSRYDLSKSVDKIDVYKYVDGSGYRISGIKDGSIIMEHTEIPENKLEDYIGKELAKKVVDDYSKLGSESGSKTYEGRDLQIGGKGMKGFYGSPKENSLGIVGNVAKSLFKQEPKTTEIKVGGEIDANIRSVDEIDELSEKGYKFFNKKGTEISSKEAKSIITSWENGNTEIKDLPLAKLQQAKSKQHSIEITPELKKQVEQGQPLFQRSAEGKPKGAVETLADGRKVIHALDAPDFSTMVHEIAHVFEGDLTAAEQKIVKDFGGSEPFARGFERYLRDGKAPTEQLKSLFEKFKTWLTDIYKSLKGSPIEKRITPEIKQIFDKLLSEQVTETNIPEQETTTETESISVEPPIEPPPPQEPPPTETSDADTGGGDAIYKMRGLQKTLINRTTGLTPEQKKTALVDTSSMYSVLPREKSKKIAADLINEIGIDEAVKLAENTKNELTEPERVMILGAAMDYYAGEAKNASKRGDSKSEKENADYEILMNEKFGKAVESLGKLGTQYGQAINLFSTIYQLSNIAVTRKLEAKVKTLNDLRAKDADQKAAEVINIITDEKKQLEGAGEAMTDKEATMDSDSKATIEALEKEIADLKKQIQENTGKFKGTKSNPLNIKRKTNDTDYDKRLKDFRSRHRTGLNKDDLSDLTYFGLYHIENGITKFAEWYDSMSKKFGKFKEHLPDLYEKVKEDAVTNGADNNMFSNNQEVIDHVNKLQSESDARKMAQITKRKAIAELNKAMANNPARARVLAPRMAAKRIREDAARNLDNTTTKTEQTYLQRLVKVVNEKAREYYKSKKESIVGNDVLQFAIANGKKDYKIWENTQEELIRQIDADNNLTDAQKGEVKEFLSEYIDSTFETLLTETQKRKIINQKLIDAGFSVERVVKGETQKVVDWAKIIGNKKTIQDAKDAIVKAVTDLGFTETEAKNELDALLNSLDSIIADKLTKETNNFLNKSIIDRAKGIFGKGVGKSKIQKLVDLKNKGILDVAKARKVLSDQLGIHEVSEEDYNRVKELLDKIDIPDLPPFIRKKFEEEVQYIFDKYGGNIGYLKHRDFALSNALTSPVQFAQNATGLTRIASKALITALKTGNFKTVGSIVLKELGKSRSIAKTVLKGDISRGTAYDEFTMDIEGNPRVRYNEYEESKLLGLPDAYSNIGGKVINLNILNAGMKATSIAVGRGYESVDTFASNPIAALQIYEDLRGQIKKLHPEYSNKEINSRAYELMYGEDIEKQKEKAKNAMVKAGIEPTQAQLNRAAYEATERAINDKLAKDFYETVEKILPQAKQRLETRGITDPTEQQIKDEAYIIMGIDAPMDVIASGEREAQRLTGKKTTPGLTMLILSPIEMLGRGIKKSVTKEHSIIGRNIINTADAAFQTVFPYAGSIGRWIEFGFELTPYGFVKGLGYKIFKGNIARWDKVPESEISRMGNDFMLRSLQGAAQTITAFWLLGLMNDEDDEPEEIVTGAYQEENYNKEKVAKVGSPKRSFKLFGNNIPIDMLGTQAVPMIMWSDFLKRRKDPSYDEKHDLLYIAAAVYMESATQAYSGFSQRYGSVLTNIQTGKDDKALQSAGTIAGQVAGKYLIPFNRTQADVAQLANPESQQSVDFGTNLIQQLSIVKGFPVGKPNYDYRGRTVDIGDIYAMTADGFAKMFEKPKYGDDIDAFLAKIDFAATDAYRESKSSQNAAYRIFNKDGTERDMTPDEYYDFKYETGKKFDEFLKESINDIKSIEVPNPDGNGVDKIKTAELQKKVVSDLLKKSKEIANSIIQEKQ